MCTELIQKGNGVCWVESREWPLPAFSPLGKGHRLKRQEKETVLVQITKYVLDFLRYLEKTQKSWIRSNAQSVCLEVYWKISNAAEKF